MKRHLQPHLTPILLLLLSVFTLYYKALGHDFLGNWDDAAYVTGNPEIRGFTGENLRRAFSAEYLGNYAPLHTISYMLDYTLWGLNATGFKLTNILLHAFNTLLYYALLVRITSRRTLSLAAAALFLCHPVQVESVVWISQRKNLLAMFFFLISFLAYLSWKERQHLGYYAISLAAFMLAVLSKSVVVIFPLVLICYDFCFRERETLWRLLREKLPYLALAMACAVVALYSQEGGGGGRTGYLGGSPLITFFNMLLVFSRYLILLFAPIQLSIIYNNPIKTAIDTELFLSALLIIVLIVFWVYLYRRNRGIFFWSSLFIIGLLPVSNVIPMQTLMNDRYLYFPMLGFAAFVAHITDFKSDIAPSRQMLPLRILFCAALLALSTATWKRIDVWHDSSTLWNDAVIKSLDKFRYGHNNNYISESYAESFSNRGYRAEREGRIRDARNYYMKALVWDPTSVLALNNLAGVFLKQGKALTGIPYLIRLTEIYLRDDDGFTNLGLLYYLTGEPQKAEESFQKALQINPDNNHARYMVKKINGRNLKSGSDVSKHIPLTLSENDFISYIPGNESSLEP